MIPSADYQQVEFYVACRNLKDLDFFGKSDPKVKLYMQDQGLWKFIGETERIKDNLNPDFKKTFLLDYMFETQQNIKFEVIDVDNNSSDDLIGVVETTVGAVMGARKQTLALDLHIKGSKRTGQIIIKGDKTGSSRNQIFWQWSAEKLMNTDGLFGKSDPFLRFLKLRAGGDPLQVHETEVIKDNLNPIWKTCKVSDDKLCSSNHGQPIRVECWDHSKSGKHNFIGSVDITLNQLAAGEKEFVLKNQKKSNPGKLKLLSFSIQVQPTFIDYLKGGEQLNTVLAIDFTGSNGDPKRPDSLHAMLPGGALNEYQKAIQSVCQILLNYDFDRMVPTFGFGGKPNFPTMKSNQVSHCFPCSGRPDQVQVADLKGLMDVYQYALPHVELSGPTYFNPILQEAMKASQVHKQSGADIYTILLILTDGEIHDMDETINSIIQAAYLPLSVIIVGVGKADFTKMEILDGDKGLVNNNGQKADRDFVQFVPFRNFNGDMTLLAKRVLEEIPNQLVEYKTLVGLKPKNPC